MYTYICMDKSWENPIYILTRIDKNRENGGEIVTRSKLVISSAWKQHSKGMGVGKYKGERKSKMEKYLRHNIR